MLRLSDQPAPSAATSALVATVLELFRVRRSALFLRDADSGAMICVAAGGPSPETWIGHSLPPGTGVAGRAVTERRPVWSADLPTDPRIPLPPWLRERLETEGLRSVAAAPLTVSGETLGALGLLDSGERVFSESDLRLLSAFADQAGVAIENARLLAREQAARASSEAAAQALLASEARRGAIIESALDCIIAIDHEGRITDFNPAAEQTFGYRRADVVGKELADMIVPPALRTRHRAGLGRYLATGEGAVIGRRIEITGMRADGTEFPVELTVSRMGTEWPPMFTGFLRDISERRHLEDQLRQAQKMEAVGRLAGGVAHDFNNLLTVITGRSQLLLARLGPDDPLSRQVELIRTTADRAATLTRQLLAFSRKQVLQPKPLDLNAVAAGMDAMLRRLIGEDVELTTVPGSGLGQVRADPGQIEQVILNLAVNARDAMPQGGRLTLETANVDLDDVFVRRHRGARPGPYVMLAVTDTGIGMGPETMSQIFEPFFTTKEQGRGTGLGLSTVYGIIKQHQGYIAAESEPGRGSRFAMYLPRVGDADRVVETAIAAASSPRGEETVLLVEGEPGLRGLAREILHMHGYAVLQAANAGEALLLCERHAEPIHLMLTNVVMPLMSGRELAKRVSAVRPAIRVLYLSGHADEPAVRDGVVDAGIPFLEKPFTPEALAQKIREVLDTRPASGEAG